MMAVPKFGVQGWHIRPRSTTTSWDGPDWRVEYHLGGVTDDLELVETRWFCRDDLDEIAASIAAFVHFAIVAGGHTDKGG